MKYGDHFGRRADDPRNFYERYSRPHNMSPEEMDLFLKRKKFQDMFKGTNLFFIFLSLFIILSVLDSIYAK